MWAWQVWQQGSCFPISLNFQVLLFRTAKASVICALTNTDTWTSFAIGIVGDAGVRGTAQQPRLFVGMILILIFAEVLG